MEIVFAFTLVAVFSYSDQSKTIGCCRGGNGRPHISIVMRLIS